MRVSCGTCGNFKNAPDCEVCSLRRQLADITAERDAANAKVGAMANEVLQFYNYRAHTEMKPADVTAASELWEARCKDARSERDVQQAAKEQLARSLVLGAEITDALRSQLAEARVEVERLRDLVSEAGPLAWVANDDMDGAKAWEVRAYKLLNPAPLGAAEPAAGEAPVKEKP